MGERYPTADKHKAVMSAHTPLADATAFFMPYVRMIWRLQCDCFFHALCAHDLALTIVKTFFMKEIALHNILPASSQKEYRNRLRYSL